MNNEVSVIVPVFNTGICLMNCLDSLCNQSYKNLSIIIVNNASTDIITNEIIDKYRKRHKNITIINNKSNYGPGIARNIGLKFSTSEFVTFLDSDDWIDIATYENCIKELSNNKLCDIAVFNVCTEYNNYISSSIRYSNTKNIIDSSMALNMLTRTYQCGQSISPLVGNKMFKTSFLKTNKLKFPCGNFEDDYFMFMCFKKANKILLIDDCALHYYQRDNSIMHSFSKTYIVDLITRFNEIKTALLSTNEFNEYKKVYYSFYERCIRSLLNQLFSSNLSSDKLQKYIKFFVKLLYKNIGIDEYIEYIDLYRIKDFF